MPITITENGGQETETVIDMSSQEGIDILTAVGFRQFESNLEYAWMDETDEDLKYSSIREIFPTYIIVARGYGMKAPLYKVPYYTEDGKDFDFKVDEAEKVELSVEWVVKSIKEDNPYTVKALSENTVGAYGVIWGDENRLDLHGEYFDKNTKDLTSILDAMGAIPFLYQHGADATLKSSVLGKVIKFEADDIGLWYEAQITDQELYKKYVSRLVKEGRLYSSSGTLPAAKSVDGNYISRWPIVEQSCTITPAEGRFMLHGYSVSEIKTHFNDIGLQANDLLEKEAMANGGSETGKVAKDVSEQRDTENVADEDNDKANKLEQEKKLAMVELERGRLQLRKLELESL